MLGSEAATTLIGHLPPVGWADVATKHDLAGLEQRVDLRFTALEDRFTAHISAAVSDLRATFEHEMRLQTITFGQEVRSQTNTTLFALVGVVLTMAALAFALVRFT